MNRSQRPILAALVVAVFGGCSDSTGTRLMPAGTLSVALSGALTGHFDVRGAQPVPGRREPATFAAARVSPMSADRYLVTGFRARDGNRQDLLSLELSSVSAPGSYVAGGNLVLGGVGSAALPEYVYRITAGAVEVTTLTATRMTGTFAATAVGGTFLNTFPVQPGDTVRLTAGTFDVPIVRP